MILNFYFFCRVIPYHNFLIMTDTKSNADDVAGGNRPTGLGGNCDAGAILTGTFGAMNGGAFNFGAGADRIMVEWTTRLPRLPDFVRFDPRLWFTQIEFMLSASRITSQRSRAGAVVAVLDFEALQAINDLISSAIPVPDLYDQIKERLIVTFSVSSEVELRSLLEGEIFTDGRPSFILSKIRHLSRGKCNDDVIKAVFMEQLPAHCRAILALSDAVDLTCLASVSDKIMAQNNTHAVDSVSSENDLAGKMDLLMAKVEALTVQSRSRNESPFDNSANNRNRSRSRNNQNRYRSFSRYIGNKCFYHFKFGKEAKKCKKNGCPMEKEIKSEN